MPYVKQHIEYLDDIEEFDTFEELVKAVEIQGKDDGQYRFTSFGQYRYRRYSDLISNQLKILESAYQKKLNEARQLKQDNEEKKDKLLADLFDSNKELLKSLVNLGNYRRTSI